jgi:hypothetical protein
MLLIFNIAINITAARGNLQLDIKEGVMLMLQQLDIH